MDVLKLSTFLVFLGAESINKMFHSLYCFALFLASFLRLAVLRVHSQGLVTIDLQCYEEDNIAQLDNVGDLKTQYVTLLHFSLPVFWPPI